MRLNFKPGRQNKVHIYVDGEYRMTADNDFVLTCGYKENSEIDDEELADLEQEVNSRRAFLKACDLISMRDHSSGELLIKLRQKGFSEGAESAIEKLTELGYIDDERFARSYAAELQRLKHFGKRRIEQELYRKGIDKSIISLVTDELDFDDNGLADIIKKKYGRYLDTEKGVARAINGLVRMGYSYGEIKKALEELNEEAEYSDE